jgi:hypothetical protein
MIAAMFLISLVPLALLDLPAGEVRVRAELDRATTQPGLA